MDDNQFRYEAFKNNTFNLKAVEKSLEESKMSSYEYLKQFQLNSTGYKRFDFKMQHSFLVFIEGKLYTEDIKVLCKEDKTYMIFICKEKPSDIGIPIKTMLDMLERNVDVSIVFVPNVGLANVTTNGYRVKDANNYQGLPYRLFNLSEHASYNEDTLSYVKYRGVSDSKPTTVSFGSKGVFVDKEAVQLTIDTDPRDTTFDIQLIPLRYLMVYLLKVIILIFILQRIIKKRRSYTFSYFIMIILKVY